MFKLLVLFYTLSSALTLGQSNRYELWIALERFSQTYGGGRDDAGLNSVLVEGQITQGEDQYDFILRKQRPNSIRYMQSRSGTSITFGYNGSSGWQLTSGDDGKEVRILNKSEIAILREEADFEGPLLRNFENYSNRIRLVRSDKINNEPVRVIEIDRINQQIMRYYLSEERSYILMRELFNSKGECILTTYYRDYRLINNLPFAFEVENFVGEERVSSAQISKVEVNHGILSFYFEKPND